MKTWLESRSLISLFPSLTQRFISPALALAPTPTEAFVEKKKLSNAKGGEVGYFSLAFFFLQAFASTTFTTMRKQVRAMEELLFRGLDL